MQLTKMLLSDLENGNKVAGVLLTLQRVIHSLKTNGFSCDEIEVNMISDAEGADVYLFTAPGYAHREPMPQLVIQTVANACNAAPAATVGLDHWRVEIGPDKQGVTWRISQAHAPVRAHGNIPDPDQREHEAQTV